MRKRIILCILLLLCIVSLAGCARIKATITIKNNGKADVEMIFVISDSLNAINDNTTMSEETLDEYRELGYKIEEYKEDGYTGYLFSQKNITLNDKYVLSTVSVTNQKGNYIIDIPWDTSDESSTANYLSSITNYISSSGGYAEFVIVLPTKPISHNATSVSKDGKALTWNLLSMENHKSIHVEYSEDSYIISGIIIACLALVTIGAIVIVCKAIIKKVKEKKKTKIKSNDEVDELMRYKTLLDEGAITQEDYDRLKNQVLGLSESENN